MSIKETWLPISNLQSYQVSSIGRIKSLSRLVMCGKNRSRTTSDVIRKLRMGVYISLTIEIDNVSKHYMVHRLVAEAFIDNPNKFPCVNHKDGNKHNNNVSNLEWCTHRQNTQHAYDTGLVNRNGEQNGRAKLTKEDVKDIRMFARAGIKAKDIVKVYPVSVSTLNNIVNLRLWRYV